MVGVMAVMVTSFKRTYCQHTTAPRTVVVSALDLMAGHCQLTPLPETPGHSQACLAQSLVRQLLLSPGFGCTQGFVCALQVSVSPVLWNFCNQIPLAFKVEFLGFSILLLDPQVGKSVVGPRTFTTV